MKIQLIDLDAWDGAAVRTLRFATHGYMTARSDAPADTVYAARIAAPIEIERYAVGEDQTRGKSSLSIGSIDLVNADGALDALAAYAYAGRKIVIRMVDQGAPLASSVVLFTGIVEQPLFDWSTEGPSNLRLVVRDSGFMIDQKPVQTARYGGTNALPAGLDGGAELAQKWKPRLFGYAARVAPPCINTARLIYQVSDGAIADVSAVYDVGIALGRGPNYASQAELESTNPAAGQYRVWPEGGMFRLGSTPAGLVTCDAHEGATATARYPGAVIGRVLAACGIAGGSIDSASFSALDAACPWELGYWAGHDAEVSGAAVVDAIATSVGGWWACARDGAFRAGTFVPPTGAPDVELHKGNLLSVTRRQSKDGDRGIPPWRMTVGYRRFWRPMTDGEFGGSVGQDVRADLREAYRTVAVSDTAVQSAYPGAPEVRIDTLLRHAADATALATARHAVLKARRDPLLATARVDGAASIDVGRTVRITLNRYGMGAGKSFLVTGVRLDPRIDRVTLSLWG